MSDIQHVDTGSPDGYVHGEVTEPEVHNFADHGFNDRQYIQIAVVLAFITGLEVFASYADWLGASFIPLLLFMMAVKFAMVVLFFMHLKFDSKIFSWLFYAGLFLAIGVYAAALLTFKFFDA